MAVEVGVVPSAEVAAYASAARDFAYQQRPWFAAGRPEWRAAHLLWRRDGEPVGAATVLWRAVPGTSWRVGYLPEGPVLPVPDGLVADHLDPLVQLLREARFVRVTLAPRLPLRRWSADRVLAALGTAPHLRLRDLPPDVVEVTAQRWADALRDLGARRYEAPGPGFGGARQPRFGQELTLAGRDEEAVLASAAPAWRRNLRRAAARGVRTRYGDAADLPAFHALLTEAGRREGFVPRPLADFQRTWAAAGAEAPGSLRLHLAEVDGVTHAAMLHVVSGDRSSYTHGGSDVAGRDARCSNAAYGHLLRDALALGSRVLDLRGVSDGIGADDPHVGLTRFKLGLGGEVVEYLGEWDLDLRPVLAKAVDAAVRGRALLLRR